MRRFSTAVSLFVAAVLWAGLPVRAQSVSERLPEGTLIYIEAAGIRNVSSFPGSHTGQLLLSAEMQKLHAALFPTLIKFAEQKGDAEGIEGLKLLSHLLPALLQDGGAIYLSSIDVTGPRAGLVLKAPGKGKALFDEFPNVFLKAVEKSNLRLRQVGDYAVVGIGYPAADVVLPEAPLAEKSLAGSEKFKAAFGKQGLEPLFRIYVDLGGLHRSISAIADIPEAEGLRDYPQLAEVLGLSTAGTLAVSTGVNGKNWRTELSLTAKDARGVLGILLDKAARVDPSVYAAVPAGATHVMISYFDAGRLLESTRGLVEAQAPQYREQFDSYLGLVSQTLGTDIPKEVLPHLGSTWVAYRAPAVAGTGLYGTVLLNRLKDPAKAAAGIEKLGQGINRTLLSVSKTPAPRFTFRTSTIDGVPLRTLPLALANVSVAVQGEYLIVGLQPQTVVAGAKYLASPGGVANLTTASGYKAALARLGAPETASTSFVDLPVFAPTGYQSLIFLANALGAGANVVGADVPVALLPPYYKVAGMFSADVGAWWTDEQGLHVRSETPFPGAMLVTDDVASVGVGQTAMLSSILLPALSRARESATRAQCMSNLRQVAIGLTMHANDHEGRFPPSLGSLVQSQGMPAGVFTCPTDKDNTYKGLDTPEAQAKWVDGNCQYEYLAAGVRADRLLPDVIVVVEPQGAHGGLGRTAACADGHVEFLNNDRCEQLLERSKMAIAKAKAGN